MAEMVDRFDALPEIEVSRRDARLVQIAYGWTAQIHRFARAIVALVDGALGNEANVLVKSMLEYTVTLHWLVEVGDDAVDAVRSEHQRSLRAIKLSAETGEGLMLPWAEMNEALTTDIPNVDEQAALRRFQKICDELGIEHNLYVAYRMTCGIAHPSFTAVGQYVGLSDPNDDTSPLVFAKAPAERDSPIAMAAFLLVWAGRDLDRLLKHRPLRSALQRIARTIECVPGLPSRRA